MPTYSYRCKACHDAFDIQQSFSDANLTVCPACGGALRKIFSPVGISFTGSGFYRNDSRAKPESEKAAKAGGADSSTESKPESKSESKQESKHESGKPTPAAKEKAAAASAGTGAGSGTTAAKGSASPSSARKD